MVPNPIYKHPQRAVVQRRTARVNRLSKKSPANMQPAILRNSGGCSASVTTPIQLLSANNANKIVQPSMLDLLVRYKQPEGLIPIEEYKRFISQHAKNFRKLTIGRHRKVQYAEPTNS